MLAVSLAVCKAGATVKKIPLYQVYADFCIVWVPLFYCSSLRCIISSFILQHIANLAGNKTLVLPIPAFNVINGGSHAGNKLAMQVLLIEKLKAQSSSSNPSLPLFNIFRFYRNSWFSLSEHHLSRKRWRWVWKCIIILRCRFSSLIWFCMCSSKMIWFNAWLPAVL